jgi:hypothetical protein
MKQGYKLVLMRALVGFKLGQVQQLFSYSWAQQWSAQRGGLKHGVRQMCAAEVGALLLQQSEETMQQLFPLNCLVLDWVAYSMEASLLVENLTRLEKDEAACVFFVQCDGSKVLSFSAGEKVQLVRGAKWECAIHTAGHQGRTLSQLMAQTVVACAANAHDLIALTDSAVVFPNNNAFDETPVTEMWSKNGLPEFLRRY